MLFKNQGTRLFPGSTFYHSCNLRHSYIHEVVTVGVGVSLLRSPSLLGRYFYCSSLIFFRLYLIKVRIGKVLVILWCFSSAEI